jgi:hypothetical protein
MEPYLELRWEGVHQSLTVHARDAIQPRLPDDLWALAQERVYVASDHLDYRQPLDPPLPEADATWAEALLQAAGRR